MCGSCQKAMTGGGSTAYPVGGSVPRRRPPRSGTRSPSTPLHQAKPSDDLYACGWPRARSTAATFAFNNGPGFGASFNGAGGSVRYRIPATQRDPARSPRRLADQVDAARECASRSCRCEAKLRGVVRRRPACLEHHLDQRVNAGRAMHLDQRSPLALPGVGSPRLEDLPRRHSSEALYENGEHPPQAPAAQGCTRLVRRPRGPWTGSC